MAILKPKEIRKFDLKKIKKRLDELNLELTKEKANIAIGASVSSPGRMKEIKRTIARLKTIKSEIAKQEAGGNKK